MSEREFDENAKLFAAGKISRRRFISRLVAGGVSVAAAAAFATATAVGAFGAPKNFGSGDIYGTYGTPPGHGGTPPGRGGTPPGQAKKTGDGTPPGHLGTPPGQANK
jgi:hypothetical protein